MSQAERYLALAAAQTHQPEALQAYLVHGDSYITYGWSGTTAFLRHTDWQPVFIRSGPGLLEDLASELFRLAITHWN